MRAPGPVCDSNLMHIFAISITLDYEIIYEETVVNDYNLSVTKVILLFRILLFFFKSMFSIRGNE